MVGLGIEGGGGHRPPGRGARGGAGPRRVPPGRDSPRVDREARWPGLGDERAMTGRMREARRGRSEEEGEEEVAGRSARDARRDGGTRCRRFPEKRFAWPAGEPIARTPPCRAGSRLGGVATGRRSAWNAAAPLGLRAAIAAASDVPRKSLANPVSGETAGEAERGPERRREALRDARRGAGSPSPPLSDRRALLGEGAGALDPGYGKDSGRILIQGRRRRSGGLSVCVMAGRRSGARVASTGRARSRRTG